MPRLVHKHSLAIRWFHWVNFPVLAIMVCSGLLMRYPGGFQRLLAVRDGMALGQGWHFTFAWLFVLDGLAFVVYTVGSGEWRDLVPRRRHLGEAWAVVLHDLGLRKEPLPRAKFNAAQRVVYTVVIVMGLLSTLTGLAIYRPTQLAWLTALCGGYQTARTEHLCLMLGFAGFFCLHLVQVARAGWNNFRAMVIGVERVDAPAPATAPAPPASEVRS